MREIESWEWRFFTIPPNMDRYRGLVNIDKIGGKERIDRYYRYEDHKYGLKIRDYGGQDILELKILVEKKDEIEKWKKVVRTNVNPGSYTDFGTFPSIIEKIYTNDNYIDVIKKRTHSLAPNYTMELTEIILNQQKYHSFSVEGLYNTIEQFLQDHKLIIDEIRKDEKCHIMSYPEYLKQI